MFKLRFETDNDAFGCDPGEEIARILRNLSVKIEQTSMLHRAHDGPIYDANGNRVGGWSFEERD